MIQDLTLCSGSAPFWFIVYWFCQVQNISNIHRSSELHNFLQIGKWGKLETKGKCKSAKPLNRAKWIKWQSSTRNMILNWQFLLCQMRVQLLYYKDKDWYWKGWLLQTLRAAKKQQDLKTIETTKVSHGPALLERLATKTKMCQWLQITPLHSEGKKTHQVCGVNLAEWSVSLG